MLVQHRDIDVFCYRKIRDNALQLAILRNEDDSLFHRIMWGMNRKLAAFEINLATFHMIGTDNGSHQFGSTRTNKAGKAEDLTLSKCKGGRLHIIGGYIFHFEKHIADFLITIETAVDVTEITTDHHLDHLGLWRFLRHNGINIMAILKNRYFIGDFLDFVHAMGYINDDLILCLQLSDDLK